MGPEDLLTLKRVVDYLETANSIIAENGSEDEEDITDCQDLIKAARKVLAKYA